MHTNSPNTTDKDAIPMGNVIDDPCDDCVENLQGWIRPDAKADKNVSHKKPTKWNGYIWEWSESIRV